MTILEVMRFRWRSAVASGLLPVTLVALAVPVLAQRKALTLDDIYDPAKRVSFSGAPPPEIRWIDGTHYAVARGGPNGADWYRVDAATGAEAPLFDAARMESALAKMPGVSGDEARRAAHARELIFDDRYTQVLTRISDDLFVYLAGPDRAVRVSDAPGAEEHASFSPDGARVAFVRANNLYVSDTASGRETALTSDGADKILNGRLDWVYEEEIYGRGKNQAYWWSPDSSAIAFLRLDDRPVPSYPVVDHIPYEQTVVQWEYPKAGDPNPMARLGVARVTGGAPTWIDTSAHPAADELVVRVSWSPDGRRVIYALENRTQTWLELNSGDAATGASTTLFKETTKYWISSEDVDPPTWLPDGSFLWLSDRSGWRHVYRYKGDGTLVNQVTHGAWEARTLHGVDGDGWLYFSGTERSAIGGDVYRIRLDGTGLRRLSTAEGTHTAEFSPSFAFYTDVWSTVTTPPQVRLHRSDGTEVRVIAANHVAALSEYRLSTPQFLEVKTRDGFVMEAMMITPPGFDRSRRYPVYQFTYAGPHTPQVRNSWGGSEYMFHQLLAEKGIIVWVCDNRTASGKGSESVWPLRGRFGEIELRDIEDGLTWLKQQPFVDRSRIGIHGWSYGGYMTSYALTHSKSFVMGIAGGSVTDWRDYDTVYTERYLGTPQDNPEGYRKSSPRFNAADLSGALMLVHGTIDDNVHLANTLQFAYELQRAEKPFQLMLYPRSRHGVTDPALVKHLRATMLDFVVQHLRPGTAD